jgi:hypothetical protein
MAYVFPGAGAPDYFPCRYGASKLLFRGPRRTLDPPYCAALGGTLTYGKFVTRPYPALVEVATGLQVVNLGCVNAGPDVFVNEPAVISIAARAQVCVVQIMGAMNLSNRFYSVHPRRNDRFLTAQPPLRSLFREVDFTEFHFTRHMMQTLLSVAPDRFEIVANELRAVWTQQMRALLTALDRRAMLLWVSDTAPGAPLARPDLGRDPALVDRDMVEAILPLAREMLSVVISPEALARGVNGMDFGPMDGPAARHVPGPAVHREVATALSERLLQLV